MTAIGSDFVKATAPYGFRCSECAVRPSKFTLLRHRLAAQAPAKIIPAEVTVQFDLAELLADVGALKVREALKTAGAPDTYGIITTYPDPTDATKVLITWRVEDTDDTA
jgi:hypothetical protein